ncbi:MAG: hypothetical protein WC408_06770 [Candidatus Micrarchaeia archaeon]|jgi:uncharacterized protein YwgA
MTSHDAAKRAEGALLTAGVLKRLGKASLDTLCQRISCQKAAYFAKRLGIIPDYQYNLYIHGPYSPDLADDLYALRKDIQHLSPVTFANEKLEEKFLRLEHWIAGLSTRQLELLATYDWLDRSGQHAKEMLKSLKHASEDEVRWCEGKLKGFIA